MMEEMGGWVNAPVDVRPGLRAPMSGSHCARAQVPSAISISSEPLESWMM